MNLSAFYMLVFTSNKLNAENIEDWSGVGFKNPLFIILTILVFFVGFFHAKISLSEIFEDYIHSQKIKNVANILALILSIIIPVIILILLIYKI